MAKPIIAICYDFDGTLSPGNMQEYDFIPQLNIKPKEFWDEVKKRAMEQGADEILTYMCLMLEKAMSSSGVQITKKAFADYGKTVKLFNGVNDWFERLRTFSKNCGCNIEHYIISSGIKEMIEGTPIAKKFEHIFASSFMYEQHGVARWPAFAVNYTSKTQFLFRINKDVPDVWDNNKINSYVPKAERRIPFSRMIYIGDGLTDIPCMKLVKDLGGYSIAVYKPASRKKSTAEKLLGEERVNFVAPADYSEGKILDLQIKAVLQKMISEYKVTKGPIVSKDKDEIIPDNIFHDKETE